MTIYRLASRFVFKGALNIATSKKNRQAIFAVSASPRLSRITVFTDLAY
jgi:hypothetical protein